MNSTQKVPVVGISSALIGAMMLAMGIVYIIMFLRTIERKRIGMDCYGISIVVGIAIQIVSGTSGSIFSVSIEGTNSPISGVVGSISGVAQYYLHRPRVKVFFGLELLGYNVKRGCSQFNLLER
ncbi:MAG TPA: hypothetical protein VKA09_14965 [Nitrososphaeraceae archaeon]|nr:hypothetical protein [Nitrososphaeraceae archaeon]